MKSPRSSIMCWANCNVYLLESQFLSRGNTETRADELISALRKGKPAGHLHVLAQAHRHTHTRRELVADMCQLPFAAGIHKSGNSPQQKQNKTKEVPICLPLPSLNLNQSLSFSTNLCTLSSHLPETTSAPSAPAANLHNTDQPAHYISTQSHVGYSIFKCKAYLLLYIIHPTVLKHLTPPKNPGTSNKSTQTYRIKRITNLTIHFLQSVKLDSFCPLVLILFSIQLRLEIETWWCKLLHKLWKTYRHYQITRI